MELGEGPKMSFALLDRSTRDTMFQLRSDYFPPLSTFPIILIMIDGPQGFSWSQCFLSRLLCGMFLDLGKLIYKPPPSTLQITQQAFDRVGGDLKFCLSRVLRWEFFFWSPPSKKKCSYTNGNGCIRTHWWVCWGNVALPPFFLQYHKNLCHQMCIFCRNIF